MQDKANPTSQLREICRNASECTAKDVLDLVNNGADISGIMATGKDGDGADIRMPLLHFVVCLAVCNEEHAYTLLEVLIENGVDLETKDEDGVTALQWLVDEEFLKTQDNLPHSKIILKLLKAGAQCDDVALLLNSSMSFNRGGISNDEIKDTIELVKFFIDSAAAEKMYLRDRYGRTPLYNAADNGLSEIVEMLLSNKPELKERDEIHEALLHAMHSGDEKTINYLLNEGADVKRAVDKTDMTLPYHTSSAVISKLLEGGVEPKQLSIIKQSTSKLQQGSQQSSVCYTYKGNTMPLLDWCLDNQYLDIVRQLVVNLDIKQLNDVMQYAAKAGYHEIIECLVEAKADVNRVAANLNTPLHIAAKEGRTEVMQLMLINKAEINTQNGRGMTPLKEAVTSRRKDSVVLLLSHGADTTGVLELANTLQLTNIAHTITDHILGQSSSIQVGDQSPMRN